MDRSADAKEYGLKPCPFCGSEQIILSNWGMFRCWCSECLAKTTDCIRAKDAIAAWNRRAENG